MITTSKNNSLMCVEEICAGQVTNCQERKVGVEQQIHPLKKYLVVLWINIWDFLGTDRWEGTVTFKMGDSHYTRKMDEIEAHWRNK